MSHNQCHTFMWCHFVYHGKRWHHCFFRSQATEKINDMKKMSHACTDAVVRSHSSASFLFVPIGDFFNVKSMYNWYSWTRYGKCNDHHLIRHSKICKKYTRSLSLESQSGRFCLFPTFIVLLEQRMPFCLHVSLFSRGLYFVFAACSHFVYM